MASMQEIEQILHLLNQERPAKMIKEMHMENMGACAVMRYLYENYAAGIESSSGNISVFLNVSTARVAALLHKMEQKGLITRTRGKKDARVTVVRLTDFGLETTQSMHKEFVKHIGEAIDRIGYKRMLEFVQTMHELKDILKPKEIDFID